jgi:DNA-binding transcriptional ArsR family regulator
MVINMSSPWKALSDNRQIILLLKNKEVIPTQIAEHLNFTLPAVSTSLRILKDADLILGRKKAKNRLYSLSRKMASELVPSKDGLYDYDLNLLKEYIENKERREGK